MAEQTMRVCLMVDAKGNATIAGDLYEGQSLPDAVLRNLCTSDMRKRDESPGPKFEVHHVFVNIQIPAWKNQAKKGTKKSKKPPIADQGCLPGVKDV